MANKHDKFIQQLGDSHEKRLLKAIDRLERDVIRIEKSAPSRGGKLYDIRFAIQTRKELLKALNNEYLAVAHKSILEYDKAVDSIHGMFGELKVPLELTKPDLEVIRHLKTMTFQGFEATAQSALDELSDIVYTSTVTGGDTSDLILSLQRSLDAKLRRHAGQMVHDSLAQFDATLLKKFGEDTGAEEWKYTGTLINTSRQWCRDHVNRIMTTEEIREEWKDHWAGKAPGDPFIVRGGYNCRHRWRPVFR